MLCVWFIGMRIGERRKYVPFIVKGLLGAHEAHRSSGSGSNLAVLAQPAPIVSEQTEQILDTLARHTFAACQSKPTRSFAAERLMEGAVSRLWTYGGCILEVSATRAGWSEVVVRRATGTAAWLCRLENR